MLFACNAGDLLKFRQYEKQLARWNDVVQSREKVEGKIRLLCLMEVSLAPIASAVEAPFFYVNTIQIALARPSKERYISFNEISQKALVDYNQVEFLVMKALSKALVSGSIDQVNATVNITWVQPRVLSSEQVRITTCFLRLVLVNDITLTLQIGNMADRVGAWHADVESMEGVVRDNAKEIIMKA